MTIDELIFSLTALRDEHGGDMDVVIGVWPPKWRSDRGYKAYPLRQVEAGYFFRKGREQIPEIILIATRERP
jgi:hypothetical protein